MAFATGCELGHVPDIAFGVAFVAGNRDMLSLQWIAGLAVVEVGGRPGDRRMAGGAGGVFAMAFNLFAGGQLAAADGAFDYRLPGPRFAG